jgi:hypothetical protein
MYEENEILGCHVGFWASVWFSSWIILAVLFLLLAIWMFCVLWRARADRVLKRDSLSASAVFITISSLFCGISRIDRALIVITFNRKELDVINTRFITIQAIALIFLFLSAASFGISLFSLTALTINGREFQFKCSCQAFSVAFVVSTVIVGLGVLTYAGHIAAAAVGTVLVFLFIWTPVHRKFQNLRNNWAPSGFYVTIRKESEDIMSHISAAADVITRVIYLILCASTLYAFCWYYGRYAESPLLMGHLLALSMMMQFVALLWSFWMMSATLTNLFQIRGQNTLFVYANAVFNATDFDSPEEKVKGRLRKNRLQQLIASF